MSQDAGRDTCQADLKSASEDRLKPKWTSLFSFTTRRHLIPLVLALAFTAAAGVTTPLVAVLLGNVFDAFSSFGAGSIPASQLMQTISVDCVYLLGLGGITWILQSGYFILWLAFGELQAKSTRDSLFEELLRKDLEWFELRQDGVAALLARLQT
jgi:ATP-binding cassette subfamily B (MDR/TAP) protein 1